MVRDLGKIVIEEIKEVFRRINLTNYALNAMEIQNARFDGELKQFGEKVAQDAFFEEHKVFHTTEIRRMQDVRFALIFTITIMSTYFNRDNELDEYLERYNEDFDDATSLRDEIEQVFQFINNCSFEQNSRIWKKADLLTILVEVHRALIKDGLNLDPAKVKGQLTDFYSEVDSAAQGDEVSNDVATYYKAAIQASNDRSSRIARGKIVQNEIRSSVGANVTI